MGGLVPASLFARGTDTVPAMLTPGELILNEGQQAAVANGLSRRRAEVIEITNYVPVDGEVIHRSVERKRLDTLRDRRQLRSA
jgi:hypothetical protein